MAKPVLYNGGGGGSWDNQADDAGGGSTQSPGRSKPKRNNTNIEGPNVNVDMMSYKDIISSINPDIDIIKLNLSESEIENLENIASIGWENDTDRKELIAKIGVKLYEYHGGSALDTLADTTNLIKYLAGSNTKQFIDDLVDAFSSKDYKSYRNPNYKSENIERKIAEIYDLDWMEPTGFNEKLYDTLRPSNDQTHHFVAFVEFGYKFGTIGFIGSRAWEILNNKGKANPGDVKLGDLGVVAGLDVKYAVERFGVEKGFGRIRVIG